MKIRERMWLNGTKIVFRKWEAMKPGQKLNGRERLYQQHNSSSYATRADAEAAAKHFAEVNGFTLSPTSNQTWTKEYEV